MNALNNFKKLARKLKNDLFVLYLSYKDLRTPLFAKIFAICVVAYAFSPIDLIPDFIPVLGYLDDLLILPLGISLALRLIPSEILEDNRARAEKIQMSKKPKNWFVATLIIIIWILIIFWIGKLAGSWFSNY